ncbi:MAG: tyrosinase family protein [Candidatus Nitrosotenuis sp.]
MSTSDAINVRKNVNTLTSAELAKLRSAFKKAMKLNDNRGFAYFAGFHGYPSWQCWHGPQSKDGWPGVRLFFPWHRAYLYTFERALQDLEPGVAIPWWDWRSSGKGQDCIPKAFSDEFASAPKEGTQNELLKPFYDIVAIKDIKKIRELLANILKDTKHKETARKILKLFIGKLSPALKAEFGKNFDKLFDPTLVKQAGVKQVESQQTAITTWAYFLLSQKKTLKDTLDTFSKTSSTTSKTDAGEPNPLYGFRMKFPERNIDRNTRRFPGKSLSGPLSLPTYSEIASIQKMNHFDDFTDAVENIHGLIHVWTGGEIKENGKRVSGDMGTIAFAAYDPIFWAHHCTIDYLWWVWQRKHGIEEIPKHYRKMALEPFGMTVDDVLDVYDLGYQYVDAEASVNGNWSPVNG